MFREEKIPDLPFVYDETSKTPYFFIDNSTLERFTTCKRSYLYYGLHKRETRQIGSALSFGTLIHSCLDLRYRWLAKHATRSTDSTIYKTEVETAQHHLIEEHFKNNPIDISDHRTAAMAREVCSIYDWTYAQEPFSVATSDKGPIVEVPFAVPLGIVHYRSIPVQIMWTGRIDLGVEWDDGKFMHGDHKTTSMGGEQYFESFINDQGQIGYCWATQKILNLQVSGFFINALVVRKPTKTGTSIEMMRRRYYVEQERIDEWEYNTLQLVSSLFEDHAAERFPMETKWCVGKFGRCSYLDICSVNPSGRLPILYSNLFGDVVWSPLNKTTQTT